jgi:glycerol-3-phosphate dehydrogenase
VNDIIGRVTCTNSTRNVRLVKGSHIIVPKFWDGAQAYLLQNHDKRVIFVNPYEGDKALIGTTDIPYEGAAEKVTADEGEIAYLIEAVNRYFTQGLRRSDVLESFSGVRPLYDDGADNPSAVTRDYVFDLDTRGGAPILNIFGGKITTFRKLAEHAIQRLAPHFPQITGDWTARAPLPGGDLPAGDVAGYMAELGSAYPWLPRDLARHYLRLYGTRTRDLIGPRQSVEALGRRFGPLLYEAEVRYLVSREWAQTAEDILWRRTKHRLAMTPDEQAGFAEWFNASELAKSA